VTESPSYQILNLSDSYPYLVSINTVIAGLIAGNTIIIKPSPQTPLTAERLASAWLSACTRPSFANDIPADVAKSLFQVLHLTIEQTQEVVAHPNVGFVSFTGSVKVGKQIDQIAAGASGFKTVGLEV
jgi:acyl-CoA reductase-like NAD-dependent aldehyde dehydrogenase